MQTVIPHAEEGPWSITSAGSGGDGTIEDLTITIDRGPEMGCYSIRTMRRTGTRVGPRSSVHGQVTDTVATAALAVGCLLLEVIPASLHRHETIAAMDQADARSRALAQDRDGWSVATLTLDNVDYALFTRAIPEGNVAHADLGWATIAMWSSGPLHNGPFGTALLEPSDGLTDR